ncbi:MAG: flagellar filament capping protein FliD [Oscillospiraceae bacterium]|nr:flagellar filament capping protein FliD [Oscillospiraceae bacterium]
MTTGTSSSTESLYNDRFSGIMSGIDTESIVKAMASGTKTKINKQKQKLQTLQWQQEKYSGIVSKISSFQEKYLSMSSNTSIKANAVMNKFVASSSDDRIVSSAVSTANPATYYIKQATAATAARISSNGSVSADKISLDFSKNVEGKEYTVKMTLDGTRYDVKFTGGADEAASKQNFLDAANEMFKDIKTADQGFAFKDGTSDLIFNGADDGIYHTFDVGYNSEAVGLPNDASSRMSLGSRLGQIAFAKELKADSKGNYNLSINGVDFTFSENSTINEVVNTINQSDAGVKMTFSSVTQSFELESTITGTAGSITMSQKDSNLLNALFNTDSDFSTSVFGKNGTITVSTDGENYQTYTSASNSYTFDGTTINISDIGEFTADEANGIDEITIETKKDTSSIKDVVVNFINDYNELIGSLYEEVNTARPKSSGDYYDPLTEEQEAEMDADEIEKWNENAKKGLLYHDSYVTRFLSSIRTAMTASVGGFSLSDMGITVSSNLSDYGKLIINEEKLDASIESYGDEITKFFTNPDDGLAAKVNKSIDQAIQKTTTDSATGRKQTGYLTLLVGHENTNSAKESMIYSQINTIQKMVEKLETKYENEMERYWKKFTALETYMSDMNAQASVFVSDY